jgi:hypothetical protein
MFGITDEHKHKWNDWLVNNGAKVLFVLFVVAINLIVIIERLHCLYRMLLTSDLNKIISAGKARSTLTSSVMVFLLLEPVLRASR